MSRKKRSAFGNIFQRTGRKGWYVRVRYRGKEITRWAGPDRRTAEEVRGRMLRRISREELLGEKAVPKISFDEFKPVLAAHLRARHAATTLAPEECRLDRVVHWFGSAPLKDIGAGDIQDFLAHLRNDKHLSIATANRHAALLSQAFKLAVEKGYAVSNPVKGVPRPKEEQRPVPFISGEDVERLEAAGGERFGLFIRVVADTGLRRGEAIALEWRDVDLRRGKLVVRRSKSRKPREVKLTARARTALRELRGPIPMNGPDRVWPEFQGVRPQAVSSRFKTIAKRAKLPHIERLHDLRHACCSRLAQAGVPLPTIQAIAGHQSIVTTQRYACHLPEGATDAAMTAMEQHESASADRRKETA